MLLKKELLIILLYLISFNFSLVYKRKKIIRTGDLMIGALIPVHEQPSFTEEHDLNDGSKKNVE